ncbi:MAG: M15 family metallopeptidase [Actinomycetota bacterium]
MTAADLEHSWRPGCPVGPADLSLVTISHWDYAGRATTGRLVVRTDQAQPVVGVLQQLFDRGFRIHRMSPIEEFEGDDEASMAANNSSGFNCRTVQAQPGVWSQHAFGTAIDLNPVQNPYVSGSGLVAPVQGAAFQDRSIDAPGMIRHEDAVVQAFAAIGWEWGGSWSGSKDYQHFSLTGR